MSDFSVARSTGSAGPTCIINGASRRAEEARALILRISNDLKPQPRVVVTKRGDDISALAARAVANNCKTVVAGGGDGTVSAVAGAVAGTDTVLGVIPIGTLNHFAKDVGIPLNLELAIRNFFIGQLTKVDVGDVNGRIFVNNAGIGVYPHFVRLREQQQREGHDKPAAFVIAIGAMLRRYFRLRVKLHMNREDALEQITPFLFVGNNKYETRGLEIGTRKRLDSGHLWVCMGADPRNRVRIALNALVGRATDDELNAFEANEISVDPGTPRINLSTDGEVNIMDTPLHFRIRPRALGIVVPASIAGNSLNAPHRT
jgi:diacylglycerol kinase family enzyme